MTANSYTSTTFDPVTSGTVLTVAENDGGKIVGTYIDNTSQATNAFVSSGGVVSVLALPGAAQTDATAVNNGGTIVGFEFASASGLANAVGFVDSSGTITTISQTGLDVEPVAINAAGTVVGTAGQGSFIDAGGAYTAFNVSGAQSTTITGISNAGEVVGNYIDASGVQHGFANTAAGTTTIDPAGSATTNVAGVTSGGEIVGTYSDASFNTYGFTDINGVFTKIQAFQSTFTVVTGVNNAGTAVGYYDDAAGAQHGFIDLGGIVDAFDPAGSVNTQPMAINANNQVVGTFDNAAGVEQGFAVVAAPSYNVSSIDPGVVGGVQTVAFNNGGEIVGSYTDTAGVTRGFTDVGGTITTFNDTEAGANTTITAINDGGTFTGFSSAGNAANGQFFFSSGGQVIDQSGGSTGDQPVAINAGGLIVGNAGSSGFVDTNGVTSFLNAPGATNTVVAGLNNAGEIVGSFISAGVQHGFTDVNGTFTTIDPAGSVSTTLTGVNATGELVGTYTDGTNTYGFTDLNGTLQQVAAPGSTFTVLTSVNNAGTAAGYATIGGQNQAIVDDGGVITVVPVPGSVNAQVDAINTAGTILGTYADANGLEHVFTANTTPACYCPGTLIRTDRGDVAVEALAIGDLVVTVGGTAEPVRWIGRRSYAARFLRGRPALLPVRICQGALANGVPSADLLVSPAHALLLDGVLVQAADLVNGTTVVREAGLAVVEYVHIELAKHGLVWANDTAAETFVDDDSRAMFSNAAEYTALYGNGPAAAAVFCAERVADGYVLHRIRATLAARAQLAA